jgi:predicted O-methyltransferase YrrM
MREPIYDYRITDYDRSILPSRFLAFLEESAADASTWVARSGRSLGHPGWGTIYHLVLSSLDPARHNVLVETGTNLGSTAIIIAQAIADSHRSATLHTIEIDPEIRQSAIERFELAGVSQHVISHLGDSHQVLQGILADVAGIRLAFLDGNHFHDHVVTEFELVLPHLDHDALVVFDNTGLISEEDEDPRVNGALRTIIAAYGGNLINLPYCSWYTPGMAVWQRQPFADMDPPGRDSFVPNKS